MILCKPPHLDAFAAQSTDFQQAFAAIALCNPSRSATMSGKSPWETGIIDNTGNIFDVTPAVDTLLGRLNTAGFAVTTGGKLFHELDDPRLDEVLSGTLDDNGYRLGKIDGLTSEGPGNYGPSGDTVLADDVLTDSVEALLHRHMTAHLHWPRAFTGRMQIGSCHRNFLT